MALQRPREAIADLDRALALSPARALEFLVPRGYANLEIGRSREAAADFREILRLHPGHAGARAQLDSLDRRDRGTIPR